MPFHPFRLGNTSTNLSNLESGRAPFLAPPTEQTRHLAREQRVHDEYSHYSTSAREEFLQDIVIENLPIEEEEVSHPTGRSTRISGSIQSNSVLTEPSLVATNESYFSKSTGRTEANILADKVIVPKNLRGTPGARQYDTHFSGATKALSLLFGAAIFCCCR